MAIRVLARSLSHVPNHVLVAELRRLLAENRGSLADVLLHLGEMDARRLHLPAAYPSLFEYCVRELHFSEHEAWARIRAARMVRRFPEAWSFLADGRLHLTAIVLLAPHLRSYNALELFRAATHRSKAEIQVLLAQRFPQADLATSVRRLRVAATSGPAELVAAAAEGEQAAAAAADVAAGPIAAELDHSAATGQAAAAALASAAEQAAPAAAIESVAAEVESSAATRERPTQLGPARVEFIGVSAGPGPELRRATLTPLASERYALRCTLLEREMADLKRARELLGRSVPSGDAARVIGRALRVLVEKLEKPLRGGVEASEVSVVSRAQPPAPPTSASSDSRQVPAAVRRQVWQRDSGQCTFVSASGRRCDSRRDLELDHVQPFARGGRTSVENLRLRCRAHDQYEADRVYGAGFMAQKRETGRARQRAASG